MTTLHRRGRNGAIAAAISAPDITIGTSGNSTVLRILQAHSEARPDITFGMVAIPNSDAGEPNQVFSLGHNRTGVGGKQTEGFHSWHMGLEREFYTGSNRQCEYYIQYVAADNSVTIRPFSANINTTTHACVVGIRGDVTFTTSAGVVKAALNDSAQLSVTGAGAFIGVAVGGAALPNSGSIRLVDACNIVGRRSSTDFVFTQLTASPNMIIGSTGNACGMFVDAGTGQSITLRPNAAGQSYTFSSTALTMPTPIGLWSRTVAELGSVTPTAGRLVYCSNGNAGAPCLAVGNGTNWLRVALGAAVSAS